MLTVKQRISNRLYSTNWEYLKQIQSGKIDDALHFIKHQIKLLNQKRKYFSNLNPKSEKRYNKTLFIFGVFNEDKLLKRVDSDTKHF